TGGIGRRDPEVLDLRAAARGDFHPRSEDRRSVGSDLRADADPALAVADRVLEEPGRSIDVDDDQIQVAVIVDVGDRASAPRHADSGEITRLLPFCEAAARVGKKTRPLR